MPSNLRCLGNDFVGSTPALGTAFWETIVGRIAACYDFCGTISVRPPEEPSGGRKTASTFPPPPPTPPTPRGTESKARPLCDIPLGRCFFMGPWTVTRSSLRMLRRVAAFCRPLRPVLLLVLFPRSRSPVVGVLGLCIIVYCRRPPFIIRGALRCSHCHSSPLQHVVCGAAAENLETQRSWHRQGTNHHPIQRTTTRMRPHTCSRVPCTELAIGPNAVQCALPQRRIGGVAPQVCRHVAPHLADHAPVPLHEHHTGPLRAGIALDVALARANVHRCAAKAEGTHLQSPMQPGRGKNKQTAGVC